MMKKNKVSRITKYLLIIVGSLILLGILFWPMPDYVEGPGEANNLGTMVKINHHLSRYHGKLMLTSVEIGPLHPITYLWAKLNPEYSVEKARDITGDQNSKAYNRVQKFYMQSAISNAKYVAFRQSHHDVKRYYRGIYVVDIMPKSRFRSLIHVGDVITSVDHHHFNNAYGYQKYLAHLSHRSKVTIDCLHNGKKHHIKSRLTRLPSGNYGLGVILTDDAQIKTKIPVNVNYRQIGGPSGGLMLALQMYSQIKPLDITKGRKIAGTGTIDSDGNVGEIGGIDKKIIAAKRRGAKIFLTPYLKPTSQILRYEPDHMTNYQLAKRTARKYDPKMKIVPVRNFNQALRYLERT